MRASLSVCYTAAMLFFILALFPAAAARLFSACLKNLSDGGKNMGFEQGAYGARIKQLRIGKGLTQEQLAEKMNVTGTYIVKIENGQRTGSVELAVELAAYFGVSLDYLLMGGEHSDKKRAVQTVIAFLSELEAEL